MADSANGSQTVSADDWLCAARLACSSVGCQHVVALQGDGKHLLREKAHFGRAALVSATLPERLLQLCHAAVVHGSASGNDGPHSNADTSFAWAQGYASVAVASPRHGFVVLLCLWDAAHLISDADKTMLVDVAALLAGQTPPRSDAAQGAVLHTPRDNLYDDMLFQKSLLQSQTEASLDGILVVDNDGQILLYNRRFVQLWNFPTELLQSRSDEQLLSAVSQMVKSPEAFFERVDYLYKRPVEASRDEVILKDGRVLDRYSAPVKSANGTQYGRVWFFRDVSEQVAALRRVEELVQALHNQRQWLEALLHLLPVPVLWVEPQEGVVTFANRAADTFAGGSFPRISLRAEPPAEWAHVSEALQGAFLQAFGGDTVRARRAIWDDGQGTPKSILLHAFAMSPKHAHDRVVVLAFDDITALQQTQSELQQAVHARDEFLSIASHELKTPVTALHLQIQNIMRASASGKSGKTAEPWLLEKVQRSEKQLLRLSRLIDNLLDVSRITGGRLEFEPERLDLAQVAQETADRLRDEATRVGSALTLNLEAGTIGFWDRLRLEQVITNLITNAVKYGSGKPIVLSVEAHGGTAYMKVRDHGIGITPENQARIFERFERAVSARQYGGLGLGLWITRQIVEALDGSISVTSASGQGSTFTVTLPTAS